MGRHLFSFALTAVALVALTGALVPRPSLAADADKVLQHVKGVVAYQPASTAPPTTVVGKFLLPDDYLAITRAKSAALLTLPDSSIVGLGANTNVQVGAFNQTADGPGSTVTVNGGTLRFDIRRPVGGAANYRFITTTAQIAVRGTVGLLSVVGGNTTVACVACAADSVSVTVGTQTFTLLSGQFLTISAAGVVVVGAVTATVLGAFSAAGVSTSAVTGPVAATAGVAGSSAGVAAGTVGAVAGGAAAAAGIAVAVTHSSPSPSPTPTQAGQAALTSTSRAPAAPVAAPPPVAAPSPGRAHLR